MCDGLHQEIQLGSVEWESVLDKIVNQTLPAKIEATNANIWVRVPEKLLGEAQECVDELGFKDGLAEEQD